MSPSRLYLVLPVSNRWGRSIFSRKIDVKKYRIHDDQKFLLDFLLERKVLMVQGTGFNWKNRIISELSFLPTAEEIRNVARHMADFLREPSGIRLHISCGHYCVFLNLAYDSALILSIISL